MPMETWVCPKCGYKKNALAAKDIYHRCDKTKRNEWLKKEESK